MDTPALAFVAIVAVIVALAAAIVVLLNRREATARRRRIVVVGIGGGGGNAVNAMIAARTKGVAFIALNTDAQALRKSRARRIQIGAGVTQGLGAGGDPDVGERAAQEDAQRIGATLEGADLVFVTAGLGGGTGSGAAPIVAAIARDLGALTVGVVTKPFTFEGTQRRLIAERARDELLAKVDTLVTIPNDRVEDLVPDGATLADAFAVVDDVLHQGIVGIVDIIATPGLVNLDFADVRAVMKEGGPAIMGIGRASGDDRGRQAARAAIATSLLEDTIDGATGILLSVRGSSKLTLGEVIGAAQEVRASADPDANVIFGATFDPRFRDELQVTAIATGFGGYGRRTGARPGWQAGRATGDGSVGETEATTAIGPRARDAVPIEARSDAGDRVAASADIEIEAVPELGATLEADAGVEASAGSSYPDDALEAASALQARAGRRRAQKAATGAGLASGPGSQPESEAVASGPVGEAGTGPTEPWSPAARAYDTANLDVPSFLRRPSSRREPPTGRRKPTRPPP